MVFGVSSSPFLLNATIRYHLEQYRSSHPNLVMKLGYVDDMVTGVEDEVQATEVFMES